MENLILRDTNRVRLTSWGKYGYSSTKRTLQIANIISIAGFDLVDMPRKVTLNRWQRYAKGLYFLNKFRFPIKPDPRMIAFCGYSYEVYRQAFSQHCGKKLFLLEEPNNFIAYYAAQEAGFKILVLPHNLETLMAGSDFFTGRGLPHCLEMEIHHLAMADAVFCISREEQWLLRSRQVEADLLPYYPPEQEISDLLKIRDARQKLSAEKRPFLMLGSAINAHTLAGMIVQIEWLKQIYESLPFEVDIVGYGTEQLQPYIEGHPAFRLHGTVEPQQLEAMTINARAMLIHQSSGVGALTRIPEMLVAGVPVIANSHAARSAFHYPGVSIYNNPDELATLIQEPLEEPALIPSPIVDEKRLIHAVQCLSHRVRE
ncbi:glycosyltransferase family 1 protein [Leptolyngbya ohadii]|uniref:glycosyltransferase family 1 protein n=1 Tax=Leptolyngbya ohadii TaxID=1962290 RepID=UPI000B59D1BC|nr:glycosyltransferase family 1 protein [Leptolyngbya ohadii]